MDDLLAEVDVLVDGPYLASYDNGRGLRGSTNQVIHHLTGRLADVGYDVANRPRTAEVSVRAGEIFVVGVPPPGLVDAVDTVANRVRRQFQDGTGS